MYNTTPEFRTLMAEPSRTLSARGLITYPDLAQQRLTAAMISSIQIDEDAGEHLPLGTAGASTLTLKLDNRNSEWERGGSIRDAHKIEGAKVELEIGAWDGAAWLWENLGTYILEDAIGQEQETLITFKGMDYLGNKALGVFIDDLAYPMTLAAMADLACFQSGFTRKTGAFLNSAVIITERPDWPGDISCRDALAYIAEAAGGFARIDRNGQLEFVTLDDTPNYEIGPDRYMRLTRQAETFALNAIIFEGREATEDSAAIEPVRVAINAGLDDTALNSHSTDNPLLVPGKYEGLKTPMTSALLGLSFIGASIDWQGDPTLTAGDCVKVTDLDGKDQSVIIAKNNLTFGPGFNMTSGNALKNDAQAGTHSSKPRIFTPDGKINAAAIDGTIKRAQIGIAAIATAHIDDASISTAKIKDAAITTAKIQDAQITNAKIAAAGIDFANIKDVNAGTAIFRTGVGDALYLDRLVVNSANIGTATIGELMVRDAQGKLHKVLIGTNGVVSSTEVKVDGQNLSNDAMMQVSQRLVWRQATQPSAPFIGMIWMDTSATPVSGKAKEILKRCTAITPSVVWEVVQSNELHTNVIDVDDNGMNILSGGNLNLLAGGNLNIKNLSNTANVINMDSTGMTLSSTGQLKLQSTDSIIIGGSPFSVGGTNLLKASDTVVSNSSYNVRTYVPTEPMIAGEKYTISMMVTPAAKVTHFTPYVSSGYNSLVTLSVSGTSKQLVRGTFTASYASGRTPSDNITYADVTIYRFPNDGTVTANSTIHWVKLEKGTMATDWSPSPQDTVDVLDALDGRLGDVETRVQVFYQTTKPTYTAVGDLWYDTDSNPLEVWKCTNVSTQAHTAFTDPVLTRALSAASAASNAAAAAQGTANSKINTFVGSSTPTALAPGDLWLDTGNKNIWKRATAAGTGGWMPYLTAAGYVNSTGITIDGTDLTVKATGNLNLAADGNLNVQNNGNLNVLNGGKINLTTADDLMIGAQNITAFADGRIDAKASTIDLSANNSIKLAVTESLPRYVNMLRNTGYVNNADGIRVWSSNGEASIKLNYSDTYNKDVLYVFGIQSVPVYIVVPISKSAAVQSGKTYTLSFISYGSHAYQLSLYKDNTTILAINVPIIRTYDNDWREYKVTFTAPETTSIVNNARINLVTQPASGNDRWIDQLQLEPGPEKTTWTPSADDYLSISDDYRDNLFPLYESEWSQGSLNEGNNGIEIPRTNRIRSPHIPVQGGIEYSLTRFLQGDVFYIFYASSGDMVEHAGSWTTSFPRVVPAPSNAATIRFVIRKSDNADVTPNEGKELFRFGFSPVDVAGGVKTSSVEVNSNGIYMDTTGTFNVNAGVGVNIKGGSGASSIGISNNDANNYFLWAGHGTPASAPFSVKRDGSVKATKIQHEMPYTFWDMADASVPAEFPIYIPSGYTIDSVTFTFRTGKARTFAKGASGGGGTTSGYTKDQTFYSDYADGSVGSHRHYNSAHRHGLTLYDHTHGINYGINEKATLATSCALKVGATTIGTYSPNPSNPVEIKAHMSAGWNTVIVAPNSDARIVAFALVKLTPA